MAQTIGQALQHWRKQRRYSQLQLAIELDISSKHISFIETSRSQPSKAMILKIGLFLSLSKREINRLLVIGGYAPAYSELSLEHKNLKPVTDAIASIIENHLPYPALVLNADWDITGLNDSAKSLMIDIGFANQTNLIEAMINDKPTTTNKPKIVNWLEASTLVLMRIREELSLLGTSNHLHKLEDELRQCLESSASQLDSKMIDSINTKQAVLTTQLQVGDRVLSFFSIIAQLGAVQEVTLSEYKVELMFPSDDVTRHYYDLLNKKSRKTKPNDNEAT